MTLTTRWSAASTGHDDATLRTEIAIQRSTPTLARVIAVFIGPIPSVQAIYRRDMANDRQYRDEAVLPSGAAFG